MDISIKRDGLTLRGDIIKPDTEKCPVAVMFHGFMSSRSNELFCSIADGLVKNGIAAVKFDFDGHGESDGSFSDMNVYSEILDAAKIIDYVRSLDFVTDIYIVGHSQGSVVGGMTAGYYREAVKKLVMLAPAASLKADAQKGSCFGTPYDIYNVPDLFPVVNVNNEHFNVGGMYFRVARTLPIYETTAMFQGKALIIHGTADDVVSIDGSKKYVESMKDARLELIEGATHGFSDSSFESVVKMTVDFLVTD